MADLSQVSTPDLQNFQAGNLAQVSTPGLLALQALHAEPAAANANSQLWPITQAIDPANVIPKVTSALMSPLNSLISSTYNADKSAFTQAFPNASAAIGNTVDADKNAISSVVNPISQAIQNSPSAQAVLNGPVVGALRDAAKIAPAVIPAEGALEDAANSMGAWSPAPGTFIKPTPAVTSGSLLGQTLPDGSYDMGEAGRAYQAANNAGATLKPAALDKAIAQANQAAGENTAVQDAFGSGPVHDALYGNGSSTVGLNGLAGRALSLQDAHALDMSLGDQINSQIVNGQMSSDGLKLQKIQNSLRDNLMYPDPSDINGGASGFGAWQQGNDIYSQGKKIQAIEQIAQKANGTQNPSSAIQTGLNNLYNNAKKTRGWSDQELEGLKTASETGIVGDALRTFGSKIIPAIAAPLGGLAGYSAGGIEGGMLGSSISGGVSYAGGRVLKAGANAIQNGRVNDLIQMLSQNTKFVPQAVDAAANTVADTATKLLPSPQNMSALPMTAEQVAIAQAQMRRASGMTGGMNSEAADMSGTAATGNIVPQNQRPGLPAPGQASALPMTAEQIAILQAQNAANAGPVMPLYSGGAMQVPPPGNPGIADYLANSQAAQGSIPEQMARNRAKRAK